MAYRLSAVSKAFGGLPVFEGLDLEIEAGEILVILGPSGCGKTTLLNLIAGLIEPEAGSREGFEGAGFSYAFQDPRLLPWLDARENARFALRGSGLSPAEAESRIASLLEAAGLGEAARRFPAELSGGMRQRLSLVRAFAYPAEILLLDEAFQAVDLRTKVELMDVFLGLWRREERTAVLVTHDVEEAVYLADRVVVLSARPARVVADFRVGAERAERAFGSRASLEEEALLYRLVLGEAKPS